MARLSALTLAAACAAASAVCRSPINPAFETPCAATLASKGAVSVKRVGGGQNVTLVATTDIDPGFPLLSALYYGADLVLEYFTGAPGGQSGKPVILNRTVPLTIRKDIASAEGTAWVVAMAASPEQFPRGADSLPAPGKFELLAIQPWAPADAPQAGLTLAVTNFTTSNLPEQADWDAACARITAPGALPAGWAVDNATLPATLAIYEVVNHAGPWTSECWVGVKRA